MKSLPSSTALLGWFFEKLRLTTDTLWLTWCLCLKKRRADRAQRERMRQRREFWGYE